MTTRLPLLPMLAATRLFMVPATAQAVLVSVTGGFTSFSGPVGAGTTSRTGPNTQTLINGTAISPTSAIPGQESEFNGPGDGIGSGSLTFTSPVSSVEFWVSTNGISEPHNLISFTAAPQADVVAGQEFLLGTFRLIDGSFWGGLGDHSLGFSLTTLSPDPAFNGHIFTDTLKFVITFTVAGNTPDQNADFFYFANRPDLGSMRVYESFDSPTGSNEGSLDFYGKIGSLIPTRLADPTGGDGAFLNASTGAIPAQQTAEPNPLVLLGAGIVVLSFIARRKMLRR